MDSASTSTSNGQSRLAGKTCLVTGLFIVSFGNMTLLTTLCFAIGASSGFGAAIARLFAKEGARVLVCDINEEGGKKVAAEQPERMVFRKLNVTNSEDWKSVINGAIADYGRVDCLVNNAGTSYKNKVRLIHTF